MSTKKKKRIPWTRKEEKLLRKLYPTASEGEIQKAFPNRTSTAIDNKVDELGLKKRRPGHGVAWSDKEKELLKEKWGYVSLEELEKLFPGKNLVAIRQMAYRLGLAKKKKEDKKPTAPPVLENRQWPESGTFTIDKKKWEKFPPRVGFFSGIDYKDPGYRAGLIAPAFEIFADEACRYICLVGRIVSKRWYNEKVKEKMVGISPKFRNDVENSIKLEAAKELASVIPKIKKPEGKNEYIRIYIITSPTYDGDVGDEIARKLQELRPEDIRVYNPASDRVEVKEVSKVIGLVCPETSRMPSEYFSAAVDREVKDKEGQTSWDYPHLWVYGTSSSSIHEPRRGRKPPVISLPSLKRLQKVRVGENQQGIRIVEFSPNSEEYSVRTYSFKDLTKNERQFITGIKEGAKKIHQDIVEVIKAEGARPEGVIADKLDVERQKIHEALEFLKEEKMSPRKTWPGLYYDQHSQRYDFHLDWIQEKLPYPSLIGNPCVEERHAFFSCLHTGYNTTDYEYVVKIFPDILWRNRVRYVDCLGDLIAGLKHNFLEQGEVMGGMNYTEQEQFAGELTGTVLLKVFEKGLQELEDIKKLSLLAIVDQLLPWFVYIAGNHDEWQKSFGVSPLVTFRSKLLNLLADRINTMLKKHNLSPSSLNELGIILNSKVIELSIDASSYNPVFKLPSGLLLELHHPHMGRAKTKSLRGQELLESSDAQIEGQGNFHTAIVTEKWEPDLGQRVLAEAGTFVIFTDFERKKGNKKVHFGPVYLRVKSRDQRIFMTESAFYNTPILQQPRPKWTNWQQLKDELGVYRAP